MFLTPTGSQWRTPELGRSVVVSSYRGITRVQAWPRPRGKPKTKAQATRQMMFAVYQRLIKHMHPAESALMRRAIQEHNRTHRGQRGSAAIRLRDWITQVLYGRGIALSTIDGPVFYPPAVSRDASFILDHTTDSPGQLLQRAGQQWGEITPGTAGQVLTAAAAGQPNAWQTPA